MENTTHSLDYVAALRRRRWWLAVPIALSLVIGLALVRFLPKQYRAEATLGVAAPSVSPTLVNQSALIDNQERLRALTHQLLSDKVLQRVVAEEGLGTGEAAEPYVNRMRSNVKISVPDPVARTMDDARRLDAFRVAYQDSDPALAQRLTNRLAAVFIDENSQSRTDSAEKSSAYLAAERDRAHAQLVELERRLRQSKEAYVGRLPEQTQANLQTLSGLRQQLEVNSTSLRHQQERLSMIRRQLETLEQDAAKGIAVAASGNAVPDRVATLERELAAARAMYTEKHPEVQRLDAELKTALQEAVAPPPRPAVDRKARLQVDPAYRQLQADRDATTLSIRELEHSSATMRAQIGDYQSRVEAAPMVEQQLASVQREYDLAQKQYADLSAKVANATMAESVARNRDGEQFALIYPASLPTDPVSPIPSRLMLFAVMGGLCIGGALALGREYLDSSIHSTRDLVDEFDVPVLGEVGHVPAASR
jgi:succinoglycan biosynthesis transport protein ExoP